LSVQCPKRVGSASRRLQVWQKHSG